MIRLGHLWSLSATPLASLLVLIALGGCGDDDRMMSDADVDTDADMGMPDVDMPDVDMPDVMPDMDTPDVDMPDGDVPDMTPDMGVEPCSNGRRDGDETDVDCGGETCEARCVADDTCMVSPDCASGVCISRVCQPPRCGDGIRNGDETGVDCGGECGGCGLGEMCVEADDCDDTGECVDGFCQDAHCFDEVRNSDESDVDCGGGDCAPCDAGERCVLATDCATGTCTGGFCLTETCLNGELDPGEVGIDCGGGTCPGCEDGTACEAGTECLSRRCEGDPMTCTSCMDGVRNGAEVNVDCGGGVCAGCGIGATCVMNRDCGSNACEDGRCVAGARSCLEILLSDSTRPSGVYEVQPDPALPAVRVYCDMETDGGGWTMVVSSDTPVDDYGDEPYADLATLTPSEANGGVWNGMRGLMLATSDMRFACKRDASRDPFDVDMSFYNNNWYQVITAGETDADTCFLTSAFGAARMGTENPERRDNIAGVLLRLGTQYDSFDNDLDAENACADDDDFNIDFRAGGVFNDSDTDWGEDGGDNLCGTGLAEDGAWFAFFREALCFNDRLDPGEADVDCGGRCDGCPDATACTVDADCASDRCEMGFCTSCRDGIQNGDETAVDCGGTCGPCPGGTPCSMDAECASGMCTALMCTAVGVFYEEDFEGGDGGWTAEGTASSWAYGTPAGTVITGAASGTGAWVTNLTGTYNNSEDSTITSPSIDLRAARVDPILSLSLNWVTESCCDEGFVEVSTDGGDTWDVVAGTPGAQNWYNDVSNQWWDGAGTDGAWLTAGTVLTGTAGERDVRIRVHFSSDGSIVREGFGVDDVVITPATPDLAVEVLPSIERCGSATVRVTNLGFASVTRFDLTTVVDAGAPMTETITGALDPGATLTRTVMATTTVVATATAAGDSDDTNDTGMLMLSAPLGGGMYSEDFEDGPGGWQAAGVNSSWAHGVPSDTAINTADSGTMAWVTNLSANYNNDERSMLVSPCFDFTAAIADPTFTFSNIFRLPSVGDHVFVEMTTDGGDTWAKLGAFGEGTFWYNDLVDDWWDGTSSAMNGVYRRAAHVMDGAAGQSGVRLRFIFETNATTTNEGFAVDDVVILPGT